MPDFANWLAPERVIDPAVRAVAAWARIQQKPAILTVVRVTPVTNVRSTHEVVVRLEFDNESDEYATAPGGVNQLQEVVIFGVKDHPTEANTDLRRGDGFFYSGSQFRVVMETETIGEFQWLAEVQA